MTVTADTIRLISLGEYTIGTTGTIPEADFNQYLLWATDQFSSDSPGNHTAAQSDQAIGLLVCHYIDRGKTDQHITSEDAGDGSTKFDSSGSNWMKSYQAVISSLKEKYSRDLSNPSGAFRQPSKPAIRTNHGAASGMQMNSYTW